MSGNKIFENSKSYVAKTIDNDILMKSSSGGVFYSIAKTFIDHGGYVCGCVYDECFMPKHIIVNRLDSMKKMMGSKYVTSDFSGVLKEIGHLLIKGENILFSGLPCQAAALKNYLKNTAQIDMRVVDEKLLIVCVVCHGSIERRIWKAYLKKVSEKGRIINVTMRDKSRGWLDYGLKFDFEDGSSDITYRKSNGYFLKCFTSGVFERKACQNCVFKGNNIVADILLGDGWNMEKYYPGLVDERGVSSVICITEKGNDAFNRIKDSLVFESISTDIIIESNPRIITSVKENIRNKKFARNFDKKPETVMELCKKYSKITIRERLMNKMGF